MDLIFGLIAIFLIAESMLFYQQFQSLESSKTIKLIIGIIGLIGVFIMFSILTSDTLPSSSNYVEIPSFGMRFPDWAVVLFLLVGFIENIALVFSGVARKGDKIKVPIKEELLISLIDPSSEVAERQWNIPGSELIVAKRLYFDGETVILKKTDNSQISYSVSQLSSEDQAYLSSIGINRIPNMFGTWKNKEGNIANYSLEGICKLDSDTYYYTIQNDNLLLLTKDGPINFKLKFENNKMITLYESINKIVEWEKVLAVEHEDQLNIINIVWAGAWVAIDGIVEIYFDNEFINRGSFKDGFKYSIKTYPGVHLILIKLNGLAKREDKYSLQIEKGCDYNISLKYSRAWGNFKIDIQKVESIQNNY